MNGFTYEFETPVQALEKYEWDNVWWEHANESGTPRVLYIGDSISCATRRLATAAAENSLYFDGLGTSKALDNPYFFETIRSFARQQRERCAVLFNNGLHGWHLGDEEEYKKNYEQMIRFLIEEFSPTPIFLLLTTALADEKRNARVVARNRAVAELARTYRLAVIDLYSITNEHRDLIGSDGVHLLPQGYQLLARALVEQIRGTVKKL